MLQKGFDILWTVIKFIRPLLIAFAVAYGLFLLICSVWFFIFRCFYKMEFQPSGQVPQKRRSLIRQLFVDVPRRFVLDKFEREAGFFTEYGIHMFCGEQGSGKTIGCVEMMLRLQKQFPKSKTITNFALVSEDDELVKWQQLLEYTNGKQGVIVGIDEIQNWFMSGKNQLPVEMLEVVTQNRKNRRVICCTAQVFTRVNKGLREQVRFVYQPHTFLGCFTVVIRRKPVFDSEGNVIDLKYRGMYCFTHTDEIRNAYDTYKVIHTLAKEGFKDPLPQTVTNVYVAADGKRK